MLCPKGDGHPASGKKKKIMKKEGERERTVKETSFNKGSNTSEGHNGSKHAAQRGKKKKEIPLQGRSRRAR